MNNRSIISAGRKAGERGNVIIWCLIMVTAITVAAGVAVIVSQSTNMTHRRSQMVQAIQYAQGAVVIGCSDLNKAMMTNSGTVANNLKNGSNPYTVVSSTAYETVYQRTVAAPFSNQTATVQIVLTNSVSPKSATISGSATVGDVTQKATGHMVMSWAWPAAIISVNAGKLTDTSNSKQSAQDGNVSINGDKGGVIAVNGGQGLAVMANGRVNLDTNYVQPSVYSATNWGTANQIPDYTAQGKSNALFDLNRFIAVADLTPGGYSSSGNNHFTNISDFMVAAHNYSNAFTKAMQGVIVVDVDDNDPNLNKMTDDKYQEKITVIAPKLDKKTGIITPGRTNITATGGLPNGINVHGTLLLNFTGSEWDPVTEKIVVTAAFNINAANLSGLAPANPSTYPTGYPPVYSDPGKNPININIAPKGYQNFTADDDLPALIYSTGCLDMHGNADICGVLYTPCYVEIENKADSQIQFINGCVICGYGIYFENNQHSSSIISFDANTVDSLTTWNNAGKGLFMSYWSP